MRQAPGLALKPLAAANCRAVAGSAALIASQFDLVAKVIGMAGVAGELSKWDGMLCSCLVLVNGRFRRVFGPPQPSSNDAMSSTLHAGS